MTLFIHGSLSMGGVETFFVRMAKERSSQGKKTAILLLTEERYSNAELVKQAREHAEVLFISDILTSGFGFLRRLPFHLTLLLPVKESFIQKLALYRDVHVSNGYCAMFYFKLFSKLETPPILSIGLYHSTEFTWGSHNLPYFETVNRDLFFKCLPKTNAVFFNESVFQQYEKFSQASFYKKNLFPLGVIDVIGRAKMVSNWPPEILHVVSIGRLVEFKTYNLHMLQVVKQLCESGINVKYSIYGTGPLAAKMEQVISELQLEDNVFLLGNIAYSDIPNVLRDADIFVGSGTSIVEAASLGVPALIGIENVSQPETYGFIADVEGFSYNEDGLYERISIKNAIHEYLAMDVEQVNLLKARHIEKARLFTMRQCLSNFDNLPLTQMPGADAKRFAKLLKRIRYSLSFFLLAVKMRLYGSSLSDIFRQN